MSTYNLVYVSRSSLATSSGAHNLCLMVTLLYALFIGNSSKKACNNGYLSYSDFVH
jgi:hypothetical protein